MSAESLGNFQPIFKCSLDALDDFPGLFNCMAGSDELSKTDERNNSENT